MSDAIALPAPYYDDGQITIYCGDCRAILPLLAPGAADVLITDPPYGVGLTKKTTDWQCRGSRPATVLYRDEHEEIRALIRQVLPMALGICGRGLVFSGPAMLYAYPEPAAIGSVFVAAGAGRCSWGFQCTNPVLFYGKDPYLADGKGGRANSLASPNPQGERVDHPCPKPMAWMRWAVARASREGETVLDPFAGSGTTGIAARDLGRRAILIESEEHYCQISVDRLRQGVLPLPAAPPARQAAMPLGVSP